MLYFDLVVTSKDSSFKPTTLVKVHTYFGSDEDDTLVDIGSVSWEEACIADDFEDASSQQEELAAESEPLCEEKRRLIGTYEEAVRIFKDMRALLQKRLDVASHEEFRRNRSITDHAYDVLERARQALDHHAKTHGC